MWLDGDGEYVAFYKNAEVGDLAAFFVERDTTALLALFRQTLGATLTPLAVHFRQPPTCDPTRRSSVATYASAPT